MAPANPYQAYRKASVQTSDPIKLVVMLYEGSIRNLRQAIDHINNDRRAQGSERICKTLDIVNYLYNCLDFEKGGEISENLARLYDFMRESLAEANLHLDIEKIEAAIDVLVTLLDGWKGVVDRSSAETSSELPATPPTRTSLSTMG